MGPQRGGITLTVRGAGFESPALCRLAAARVTATVDSAHALRCVAPPLPPRAGGPLRLRDATLEVSTSDGARWSTDGFTFRAVDPAAVVASAVQPAAGPVAGGTLVTVPPARSKIPP